MTFVRNGRDASIAAVGALLLVLWLGSASAFAGPRRPFEFTGFEMQTLEAEERPAPFRQAGGHPWGLALTMKFASEEVEASEHTHAIVPTSDVKDIVAHLPPGLLPNPNPRLFPRCPLSLFLAKLAPCPSDTQVGVARLVWFTGHKQTIAPLVSVTPERGQSAEFGVETIGNQRGLITGHVVRDGSSYGLTAVANNIPTVDLVEAEITLWGVPADPSHDNMRGRSCEEISICEHAGSLPSDVPQYPFLTMPADCADGAPTSTISADSWEEPGRFVGASTSLPPPTGCDLLQFSPQIALQPETLLADEPTGLGVTLEVPQTESSTALSTPQVRDSLLTLPQGLSISPGVVDGIQSCEESGFEGINFEGPLSEEIGLNGEPQLAPGHCPDASTVGTAKAFSPLLDEPVEGHVYLARPLCGDAGERACTEQDALDGNLYQLYLELGGVGPLADTGVNLKVRGKVEANPATGQLTSVFENTPQLPFSKLEVHLNGGPRAPLDNPSACGPAVTTSDFRSWSAPGLLEGTAVPGTPDATPASRPYEVNGCGSPAPFAPGFVAGTVSPQAGRFSSFTMELSRADREQFLSGIQLHMPQGLLGMLSSVTLCGEAQANAGTCTAASRIGSLRVASGAGSHPFELEGTVYLTGAYGGAPFGLSVVVPIVAGPFNLGVKVVRARIFVDPSSSTLTVATDASGPYAVPQIVFGVPVRLKRITVDVDRPRFMFNPTGCGGRNIAATVAGSGGASASVSSAFAAAGCRSLAFKPSFSVSTNGRTSRAAGASLDAKLSYPRGAMGSYANIARVKVSLPRQLPSRLTTLQRACPAQVFDADPATCPSGSIVGVVRSLTPVLPSELSGPVYFVSHGGEAFPNLVVVLEGEGVRVDLVGDTFISKAGITTSTFKTIPDVPVSSFELYLPQGRDSALAANRNLCKMVGTDGKRGSKRPAGLVMPTEFVAQNGTVFKQSTRIVVNGCPKATSRKGRGHK